jgi:hypothetical protein
MKSISGEIMKNYFLVAVMMVSFNLQADDKAKTCEKKYETAAPTPGTQGNDSFYNGSDKLIRCDKLSRGHLRRIYSHDGSRSQDFKWQPYAEFSCKTKCSDKPEEQEEFKKCVEESLKLARQCESMAFVISYYDRDWDDESMIIGTKSEGGAGKAPTGATGAAANAAASYSTIKCTSKGIETVDYQACKKFSSQLELIEGVQQVSYGAQELVYKEKIADAGIKHSSEENAATGALKATADSMAMQQDMYQQRMAVDSTKLAYLYSIYEDMPKSEDISAKCDGITQKSTTFSTPIDVKECKTAVRGDQGFAIALNQQAMETMKSKLISIATSVGSNGILANLLGKRAKDANAAIAKIDAFKPTDPFVVSEEDATSTLCKQNPGLAQCLTGDLDRAFDTISDNIITFGEGATGTSYGTTGAISDGITSPTTDTTTSRNTVTPMGSIVSAAVKDNSIDPSKAAVVSTGGMGGAAPGGGGGGASAGSGSGSNPTPNNAAGGVTAAAAGKAPNYQGGDGVSVMGGFGINRAKATGKAEDNPFGKLFGKDPKGAGVVNFRDIASQKYGDKKENIFDMISRRYTTVSGDKRLIEYELTK